MSGLSPSRVRTKTSELADFFRNHPPRHTFQHEPVESPPPQMTLEVPQESSASVKKVTTRLPAFLGRTRKKSTHSTQSGALPSTSRGYDSEVAESSAGKKDRRLSHPALSPELASKQLPPVPQINVTTSPSLGSKLVAHFTHTRSRKAASKAAPHASPRSSQASPAEARTPDTLLPPADIRATSIDSVSSNNTTMPLSTPGASPTIMISSSSDNLEDYKDLFTLPRQRKPIPSRRQPSTPASEYRDKYHKSESNTSVTLPSPTNPRTEPSMPVTSVSSNRPQSSSSRSEAKEWESRRFVESSMRSSKVAKKRTPKQYPEDSTVEGSADESVLQVRAADLAPVIDVTPPPSLRVTVPTSRSRLRAPSAAKDRASITSPPTIPLPDPPLSASLPSRSPLTASNLSFKPPSPKLASLPSATPPLMRPRANTIGSLPSTPKSHTLVHIPRPFSPARTNKLSDEIIQAVKQNWNKENSSLDTMTPKQLRDALLQRSQRYDDLASHLLDVTKSHAAEKSSLEKKIAALEVDAARKDKEIQGFTWMLSNHGSGTLPADNGVDYTKIPGPRLQRNHSTTSNKPSSKLFHYADDSGAESHPTSGTESVRSGASESSMSTRLKKGLRPLTLGQSTYSIYRSSMSSKSARGPAVDSGVSDYPGGPRGSVYSVSSSTSATSSNSSAFPPSPALTLSSLSAIPESGAAVANRAPRISTSPNRDSLSASEWETDDKRTRSSRRISSSSLSSSSSVAMSAYSANLKRGRPPSIAQVLQKSSTTGMDEVLENLRPFAGSPTAFT